MTVINLQLEQTLFCTRRQLLNFVPYYSCRVVHIFGSVENMH